MRSFCVVLIVVALPALAGGVTNAWRGVPISNLDDPSLYSVPTKGDDAPLKQVGDEIRKYTDPTLKPGWDKYEKANRIDLARAVSSVWSTFWDHIPVSARRYVDIDNDGTEELFVIGDAMNSDSYLGFHAFFCLLRKARDHRGWIQDDWEIAYLGKFEELDEHEPNAGINGFSEHDLVVTDLDKDGRPDILFTYVYYGASASARYLRVISIAKDMQLRDHKLSSRERVRVIEPESLRPVFVQHDDDDWQPNDCGASVRQRGYRKAYYHWISERGFVQF